MKKMIDFCHAKHPKISRSSWQTYLCWLGQLKRFSGQPKAEQVTVAQIEAFLASLPQRTPPLSPRSQWNARQAIRAIYYHVLWDRLTDEFRYGFLLRIGNPLKSQHRAGRWRKRIGKLPAPDIHLPTPDECAAWLACVTPGKPQRACLRVYAEGLPPRLAAAHHQTSVPAMQAALRQARTRVAQAGVMIGTGTGLRALRTVAILQRIRAGDDPTTICQAVKLRSVVSLKPYLRLAGVSSRQT